LFQTFLFCFVFFTLFGVNYLLLLLLLLLTICPNAYIFYHLSNRECHCNRRLCNVKPSMPQQWQEWNFSFQYYYLIKHAGYENKGNDHQRSNVLIFNQILPTSTIRNIRRTVRKIWTLILGLKVLITQKPL